IPFKVAVTGINDWNISTTTHVDMKVKDKEEYLDKFSGRVTASGKGTIVHLIMQWADPAVYKDGVEGLMSEVGRLIEEGVFDRYQPDDIRLVAEEFADGIMAFAGSSVGIKMAQASEQGRAEFEKPVVFAVPAYEGAPSEDFVLVQGIIDAIFYDDDGAVIVDYKTDDYGPVTDEEIIKNARDRHSFQISCYAASCEASDIPVKSRYLYLVRYSRLVEI
ncbi:MAG: PD-(D/E)XK nuclease family protein, partial [Clostridiales bacterium]|nr:PD-(D/E)XK nuclease family protein [Clostridiales bacterium]